MQARKSATTERRPHRKACIALLCAALGAALGAAGTAHADEGRIPIFEPTLLDAGSGAISGQYVVTRDVIAAGATVAIDVVGTGSESIEIDLNGFTITGGPTANAVIRVQAGGVKSVKIRNGTLVGRNADLSAAVIRIGGNETDPADNMVVEDVKIVEGGIAIEATLVTNFALRRNIIVQSAVGILVTNDLIASAPRTTGIIEGNILRNLEYDAIDVLDPNRSVTIRGNQIVGQQGTGITVDETLSLVIADNNIEGGTVGIRIIGGSDCQIRNNVVTSSSGDGIAFLGTSDCFVLENSLSNNRGSGIYFFENCYGNFVEHNVANINDDFGIYFDPLTADNVYGRNVLRNNLGSIGCAPQNAAPPCASPSVCDGGTNNTSYGDNMGPGPGC